MRQGYQRLDGKSGRIGRAVSIPLKQLFIARFLIVALFSGQLLAQSFPAEKKLLLTQKDLVFAQVAVGGVIETLLVLTNRGSQAYSGILSLYTGEGEAWNPLVNGSPILDGKLDVVIEPGRTLSLRLTGSGLQAGFATLETTDAKQDNFVEGNLTYFVMSGNKLVDSIGVLPSIPSTHLALSFDDFSQIGLALANSDPKGQAAKVTLLLYADDGSLVETLEIALGSFWHRPRFLNQLFEATSVKRGRVDLISDIAVTATALTLVGSQLSALPLSTSVITFDIDAKDDSSDIFAGTGSVWREGSFLRGYVRITTFEGQEGEPQLFLITGQLIDGTARLSLYDTGAFESDSDSLIHVTLLNFLALDRRHEGTFVAIALVSGEVATGTLTLIRTDPELPVIPSN